MTWKLLHERMAFMAEMIHAAAGRARHLSGATIDVNGATYIR